jgi:hypothetical protein
MFKSVRREQRRNKRHAYRVSGGFEAQYSAMEKRERERKARIEAREVRAMKEAINGSR